MTTTSLARNIDAAYAAAEPLESHWHYHRTRTWLDDAAMCLIVWAATTYLTTFWRSAYVVSYGIVWDVPVGIMVAVAGWHFAKHLATSVLVRRVRPNLAWCTAAGVAVIAVRGLFGGMG